MFIAATLSTGAASALAYHMYQEPNWQTIFQLEFNHALVDGASVPMLLRELRGAYLRQPNASERSPRCSRLAAHRRSTPSKASKHCWAGRLAGAEPCHFPALGECRLRAIAMPFSRDVLLRLCVQHGVTCSDVGSWRRLSRCAATWAPTMSQRAMRPSVTLSMRWGRTILPSCSSCV